MKYREQKELVSNLRALADFYERPQSIVLPCPTFNHNEYVTEYRYDTPNGEWAPGAEYALSPEASKANLRKIAKAIAPCEKDYSTSGMTLTKRVGTLRLRFTVAREAVCRKVVKGTKVIPPQVIPERVEEEIEWVCEEPILSH